MVKCVITIRTSSETLKPIEGLFRSTMEATIHALSMVSELTYVKVRAVK